MKKYKAILYHSTEYPNQEPVTQPIDTVLLNEKCYRTADNIFFEERGWNRNSDLHVEIEKLPRTLA